MRYLSRVLESKILSVSKQFPVVVLNGARQAGKSTLLDHLFGKSLRRIVFDPVIDVENARQDPELFLSLNPPPVILDEIQYAPELLPVIKRIVDQRSGENGLYFITGSQQFSVMKSVSESLAGRTAMLDLHTMSLSEIEERASTPGILIDILSGGLPATLPAVWPPRVSLLQRIFKGGYPRTLGMDDDATVAWFDSYLKTYVERDIRKLGDIGDLQTFSRFTRLCAQLTAQEINQSHLGRELGVDPKTAQAWLAILKASYQWIELPAYSGNATKRLSGKPKGHFSDAGFACFLSSIHSPTSLASHPLVGHLFETYVVGEVLKSLQRLPSMPALYHWRTHGGAEVDLLLERNGLFWPLEIKFAARPTLQECRGLQAFAETYPRLKIGGRLVLSGGEISYRLNETTLVVPVTLL